MENETRRGFDLPLVFQTIQKVRVWIMLAVVLVFVVWMEWDMISNGCEMKAQWAFRFGLLLMIGMTVVPTGRIFAKVHLVSEGVAVTLFGKTIRRFPKEELQCFLGIQVFYKSYNDKWIVVSSHTVEELAEIHAKKLPKVFQNPRTRFDWAENMAKRCLIRYVHSARYLYGIPRKDLLLIEWSPERLGMLLEMYPGVPWVDLTDKKILDTERDA